MNERIIESKKKGKKGRTGVNDEEMKRKKGREGNGKEKKMSELIIESKKGKERKNRGD